MAKKRKTLAPAIQPLPNNIFNAVRELESIPKATIFNLPEPVRLKLAASLFWLHDAMDQVDRLTWTLLGNRK